MQPRLTHRQIDRETAYSGILLAWDKIEHKTEVSGQTSIHDFFVNWPASKPKLRGAGLRRKPGSSRIRPRPRLLLRENKHRQLKIQDQHGGSSEQRFTKTCCNAFSCTHKKLPGAIATTLFEAVAPCIFLSLCMMLILDFQCSMLSHYPWCLVHTVSKTHWTTHRHQYSLSTQCFFPGHASFL